MHKLTTLTASHLLKCPETTTISALDGIFVIKSAGVCFPRDHDVSHVSQPSSPLRNSCRARSPGKDVRLPPWRRVSEHLEDRKEAGSLGRNRVSKQPAVCTAEFCVLLKCTALVGERELEHRRSTHRAACATDPSTDLRFATHKQCSL